MPLPPAIEHDRGLFLGEANLTLVATPSGNSGRYAGNGRYLIKIKVAAPRRFKIGFVHFWTDLMGGNLNG